MSRATIINSVGRLAITAVILVVVWRHSHWSVALSITGLTINAEVMAFLMFRPQLVARIRAGGK